MVGAVLDWVVLSTVKDGDTMPSGMQTVTDFPISHWTGYNYDALNKQPTFKKILDVGSYDVNGSFSTYDYFGRGPKWLDQVGGEITGIDLAEGPGVDIVMNAHDMTFDDNSFDLVLCLEMLEHDDLPIRSIQEIHRVLKTDGLLILACPDDISPEHHQGVSNHYTHITRENLLAWLNDAGFQYIDYKTNHPEGVGHHFIKAMKDQK